MSWVLAVDGGNTKTVAAVADARGITRGAGRAAPSDIHNAATPEAAIDQIVAAARTALDAAGAAASEVGAAAFSLAGADWPEDFELLEGVLRERIGLTAPPLVVNDALGALRAGSPDWTGISVVAGTYNAVGARHPDGRLFHVGFWPDGAGGRHLAREGLYAVYREALGMGPATALTERALALWGVADGMALLHEFTRRGGLEEAEQDRLAPVVLDAADDGDAVAQEIVAAKGSVLGRQARACAAQLDLPIAGARVVLTGRVFSHPTERLAAATMAELPGAVSVRHGPPPVAGALLLALDRLGVDIDAGVVSAGLPQARSTAWVASR
jgi:N-acetylglucosamine kinase-like BadF-type ATPase